MGVRRLLCVSCNSKLTAWGKTKSGKKRWHCGVCKSSRIYHGRKPANVIDLFKQYVLWGLTYEMLSSISGFSVRYLEDQFHSFLKLDPPKLPKFKQSGLDEAYLLIDGLWFGRWFVLMVYRQSGNLRILHISVAGVEVATKISKDIKILVKANYRFTGIVSDGGVGIVSAVSEVFPHIPHQICLAHMHRRIIAALGRYSKDYRVRELKYLADYVWLIESKEKLAWWKDKLRKWIDKNLLFLIEKHRDETGRSWYVHTGVRKAGRMMTKLPKTSFVFLDHPTMPKTTNELEATFGHLGQRWLRHKGLKKERWEPFLRWFTYFYNKEKMSCKNTKEG